MVLRFPKYPGVIPPKFDQGRLWGTYTREQYEKILTEFGVEDGPSHEMVLVMLKLIAVDCRHFFDQPAPKEPLHKQRARLRRSVPAYKRVLWFIRADPLVQLELTRSEKPSVTLQKRVGDILSYLEEAAEVAASLADNPAWLASARERYFYGTRFAGRRERKSVERLWIWEEVLQTWHLLGNKVGYSEGMKVDDDLYVGPILRVIRTIHEALGLSSPRPHSIRQTIRDFQRGPLSRRRTLTALLEEAGLTFRRVGGGVRRDKFTFWTPR